MKSFYRKVDKRSKKKMISFLRSHFKYWTMNSWNRSTSYANNLKVNSLDLPQETVNKLYGLIDTAAFYVPINELIHDFAVRHDFLWQAGFNGRSGGYMVLYEGYKKDSGYRSRCTSCGQLNYKRCPETPEDELKALVSVMPWEPDNIYATLKDKFDAFNVQDPIKFIQDNRGCNMTVENRCGRCGQKTRKNLTAPVYNIGLWPGRGIDESEFFENWDTYSLKERVSLVQEFDKLCDSIVRYSAKAARLYEVVEKEIWVPKKIKTLQEVGK